MLYRRSFPQTFLVPAHSTTDRPGKDTLGLLLEAFDQVPVLFIGRSGDGEVD